MSTSKPDSDHNPGPALDEPRVQSADSSDSASDRAFCVEVLPDVSRTFALSIEMLPLALSSAVRTAYLLCRVVDSVEDDAALDKDVRQTLFAAFDRQLSDPDANPAHFEAACRAANLGPTAQEARLCFNSGTVFREFWRLPDSQRDAIRPHVLEMSKGMKVYSARADSEGSLVLNDMADLERYCYFVAGTVGKLLTALFRLRATIDRDEAALLPLAVSFGLGLQLVNIVKDVADDAERGICFLPKSLLSSAGLAPETLLDPTNRTVGLTVVHAVCDRAAAHLADAVRYTCLWKGEDSADVRLFCALPLALAQATLVEVRHGDDTLRVGRTPKVSRAVVGQILSDLRAVVGRSDDLEVFLSHWSEAS